MNNYKHNSEVLEFIYGRHYANILRLGLRKANYVALPGRSYSRYVGYMKSIATAPSNKAFFLDTDHENYIKMANYRDNMIGMASYLKKLSVLNKDVFHYDNNPEIPTCRVEDIGVSERDSNTLMPKLLERLGRQSMGTKKSLWKAQIIDMSKSGKGGVDIVVFKWLRYYFKVIGAELTSIDGLDYDTRINRNKIFSRGEPIHTYQDVSHKTGRVYDHFLRFESMGRIGFVKVYTYYNGSPMINLLVIYK